MRQDANRALLPSRDTNPNAETCDLAEWGLAAVRQFGCCHVPTARKRGRDFHAHDCYQITVCTHGVITFESPDGGSWKLTPGRMLVLPPGEEHRLAENSRGNMRYWLFVDPNLSPQTFHGLCPEETDSISAALRRLDRRLYHFPSAAMQIPQQLRDLLSARGRRRTETERDGVAAAAWVRRLKIRELTLRFLIEAISARAVDDIPPTPIRPITVQMRQHPEKDWSVSRLIAETGYSSTTLIQLFRRETGRTPHSFLMGCRVQRAKEFLKAGRKVGDIAHTLGFASSQHLSTMFLREAGATPTDWLRSCSRRRTKGADGGGPRRRKGA